MKLAVQPDKKYLERIKRSRLKPIRSEEENELLGSDLRWTFGQFWFPFSVWKRYLEVMSRLVEDFESQWQEEQIVEPRDLLMFLMAQNNLSQTDLIPEFGSSSRASEYLSGTRPNLSLPQILKLAKKFNLLPTALISQGDSQSLVKK